MPLELMTQKYKTKIGGVQNFSFDFFEENIRDYEYEAIVALALEALDYDDIVLLTVACQQLTDFLLRFTGSNRVQCGHQAG